MPTGSPVSARWVTGSATTGRSAMSGSMLPSMTPRTNGKAERLIHTLRPEWAYSMLCQNLEELNRWLPRDLSIDHRLRQHSALGGLSPQQQLNALLSCSEMRPHSHQPGAEWPAMFPPLDLQDGSESWFSADLQPGTTSPPTAVAEVQPWNSQAPGTAPESRRLAPARGAQSTRTSAWGPSTRC